MTGGVGRKVRDHPRSRGVYQALDIMTDTAVGSSPLARGLQDPVRGRLSGRGIIPARAGFTRRSTCENVTERDHPRSRGVYVGTSGVGLVQLWIIPARAGFTGTYATKESLSGDHPRSRGVYRH